MVLVFGLIKLNVVIRRMRISDTTNSFISQPPLRIGATRRVETSKINLLSISLSHRYLNCLRQFNFVVVVVFLCPTGRRYLRLYHLLPTEQLLASSAHGPSTLNVQAPVCLTGTSWELGHPWHPFNTSRKLGVKDVSNFFLTPSKNIVPTYF